MENSLRAKIYSIIDNTPQEDLGNYAKVERSLRQLVEEGQGGEELEEFIAMLMNEFCPGYAPAIKD